MGPLGNEIKYLKKSVNKCVLRGTACPTAYELKKNVKLEHVDSCEYLGVYLSSNLKWNDHIDYTLAKASKMLYFYRANFENTSRKVTQALGIFFCYQANSRICVSESRIMVCDRRLQPIHKLHRN